MHGQTSGPRTGALDKIVPRLRNDGREVEVLGCEEASADIVDRFALYDKTGSNWVPGSAQAKRTKDLPRSAGNKAPRIHP